MSVLLAFGCAVLFATGTWMLLQRRLSRILIGVGLMGHGANILLLTSGGEGGESPIIGTAPAADFSDPLPQALALTSIVITFGVTAFLLALGYRSWKITHDDVVEDDVEDRFIASRWSSDQIVEESREAEREQAADEDRL
ncbi:MAG: NADH-quinone oxidoreductase subunit K [Ilumatobacteraceae bacterium]|nr:NADH-quinone oxidoreductase subunit K [Ilumatobacteraceae bacterium]